MSRSGAVLDGRCVVIQAIVVQCDACGRTEVVPVGTGDLPVSVVPLGWIGVTGSLRIAAAGNTVETQDEPRPVRWLMCPPCWQAPHWRQLLRLTPWGGLA